MGSRAPNFTLPDQSGHSITLSEILKAHRVLLVFYPGDMTPGCTMQLCAVRDDWSKFQRAHIKVYGINNGDAQSHKKFSDKHALPFPLLIDAQKKVTQKYGFMKKFFKATIVRRTVVGIDTNGIIVYLRHGMPKNTELLKAFA